MSQRLETGQGTVAIRQAVPADAEMLFALRLEGLGAHPEAFAADYAMTEADGAEFWALRIADNAAEQRGVICVAEAGDELLGLTGLVRGHWPKTQHSGIVWGVYVQPAWRGLGVADALIEACIDWGRAQGMTVVKLGVANTNTLAIRCYDRCGFTVYGVEPQVIHYEGTFYDELLMARAI